VSMRYGGWVAEGRLRRENLNADFYRLFYFKPFLKGFFYGGFYNIYNK